MSPVSVALLGFGAGVVLSRFVLALLMKALGYLSPAK
jgi:hypothetical protein